MIYTNINWSFNDYTKQGDLTPLNPRQFPTVEDGDVFISCNFTRKNPYTKLFDKIKDLTFLNCNLNGVDIKTTWILDENCSFAQNEYIEDDNVNATPQAPV